MVVKGYDLATAAEASTGAVVDGGGEAVAKPSATQTRSTGTSSRGKGPTDAPTAKAAAAAAAVSKTSSSLDLDDGYQSGDPLGRKRLGKDVVRWLSRGMAAMASDIAAAEASGERLGFLDDLESGVTLVTLAQPYLGAAAMPMGHEAVCLKVSSHYPTLFDHLQRELQGALQALQDQGVLEKWQDAESWLFLKKLARSDGHRVNTRKTMGEDSKLSCHPLSLSAEEVAAVQANIDRFVAKSLELLRIERDAELEATQESLDSASYVAPQTTTTAGQVVTLSSAAMPTPGGGVSASAQEEDAALALRLGAQEPASGDEEDVADQERRDTISPVRAVKSSTGLGGSHLVSFRPSSGNHLPTSTISPGDMVCVRLMDKAGAATTECMRGRLYSLSEDGSTVTVSIDARYGDPACARLFGRAVRIDRISELADITTYQRNCDALEKLREQGLQCRNPSLKVVATLFGATQCLPEPEEEQEDQPTSSSGASSPAGGLDWSQESAVRRGLDKERPVVIIQGPPGTGKTSVVVELIARAIAGGERVLATAPTNAAVDNLVERLGALGINVVRVGNPVRVAASVVARSLAAIVDSKLQQYRQNLARRRADLRADLRQTSNDPPAVAAGIRQVLKQLARAQRQKEKAAVADTLREARCVLSTNTGAADPLLLRHTNNSTTTTTTTTAGSSNVFDLVVVDEAGQATEPSCWIPALQGRRLVLAGDTNQLAPTILSRAAAVGGLGESLMERAAGMHDGRLATHLAVQYRMNAAIAGWADREMYQGRLRSAPQVAARLLSDMDSVDATPATRAPMLLLDTRLPFGSLMPGCEERIDLAGTGSYFNEGEAEVVAAHVVGLLAAGVPPSSIAVLSPYLAQVQLLQERLEELLGAVSGQVEVASVDGFQGREADAVVISMVRSNSLQLVGFLADRRRMNVAITRARRHVAVVCDSATVGRNPFLRNLLQHIRQFGEVRSASQENFGAVYSGPIVVERKQQTTRPL